MITKKVSFGILRIILIPKKEKNLRWKGKNVLSLSRFSSDLVIEKLSKLGIKIAISAIKIKIRKLFSWKSKYLFFVALVPTFHFTARSSSNSLLFLAFFLHVNEKPIYGKHPIFTFHI